MEKQEETSDEFSYQDSNSFEKAGRISSVLDDKGAYYFSWTKTILVTLAAFAFVVFSLSFLFQMGKKSLLSSSSAQAKTQAQVDLTAVSDQSSLMQEQLRAAIQDSANDQVLKSGEGRKEASRVQTRQSEPPVMQVKQKEMSLVQKNKRNQVSKSSAKISKSAVPALSYKVIAGTFSSKANAQKLINNLKQKKIPAFMWLSKKASKSFYKVQVGAFSSRKEAEAFRLKISKIGFQSYIFQKK